MTARPTQQRSRNRPPRSGAALRAALEERVARAPRQPGVYLMRDSRGEVLYVGKAQDLRARIRSYFRAGGDGRFQIDSLVERIADIEFLVTATEKDALLLENNLIKQIGPRFNIRLRDDKSYVIVKLNVQHPWPRALVTRGFRNDGSLYFGPYASADQLRRTMKSLARVFPLRLCSDHTLANRTRPCVYHDIDMCSAPCVGLVDLETYRKHVDGLVLFLRGRDRTLLDGLRREMEEAATARRYEVAAALRDQIQAIERTVEPQRTEETGETYDRDVFGYHWDGDRLAIQVLFFRDGKLVNSGAHRFRAALPVRELLSSYLVQFYDGEVFVPPEIMLPVPLQDAGALAHWFTEKAGRRVRVLTPRRGPRREQVAMASANAAQALAVEHEEREQHAALLAGLREALGLANLPERIECFDISHLGGGQTVGSRVTFSGGIADRDRYRRYRVRTPAGGDDHAALDEVLTRRLRRGLDEADLPDLMIIDGGKAQLDRVLAVMARLNVVDIDVIGLAKRRRHRQGERTRVTDERIYRPGETEPIVLPQDSPEHFLLVRIRDEAHRFAITYHRTLRRRRMLESGLEAVPGIGPRRRRQLIEHFGSPRAVAAATVEELTRVPGIGATAAARIAAFFGPAGGPQESPGHSPSPPTDDG
ncbi:MAG: excinuclease ABC subunit UvrC [Candidatus Eiseniibacteriota bacterium]|jgi:excinuclease ABC subunit C